MNDLLGESRCSCLCHTHETQGQRKPLPCHHVYIALTISFPTAHSLSNTTGWRLMYNSASRRNILYAYLIIFPSIVIAVAQHIVFTQLVCTCTHPCPSPPMTPVISLIMIINNNTTTCDKYDTDMVTVMLVHIRLGSALKRCLKAGYNQVNARDDNKTNGLYQDQKNNS